MSACQCTTSGRFRNVSVRRYLWDASYGADEYIAVLDTYSGHRSMADDERDELYRRIRARIGDRTVTKTYLFTMNVAARL